MKLLFFVNPKAGRGHATRLADAFEHEVSGAGHTVDRVSVGEHIENPDQTQLGTHDVSVVFGGDGTVHSLLPAVMGTPTAIYHVPMGTENLFARQFGMDQRPATLHRALDTNHFTSIDVGDANGRPFAIMCSAGPDAAVVRRLAATRTGSISHTSYIKPILSEIMRPSLGPVSVEVDGQEIVNARQGMLVIGNSPMYALGLNPARDADMTDGLLDVVFLPASTSLSLVRWAMTIALSSPTKRRSAVFHRARSVVVRSDSGTPYQLDGDEGGVAGNGVGDLRISVKPRAVRVLSGK